MSSAFAKSCWILGMALSKCVYRCVQCNCVWYILTSPQLCALVLPNWSVSKSVYLFLHTFFPSLPHFIRAKKKAILQKGDLPTYDFRVSRLSERKLQSCMAAEGGMFYTVVKKFYQYQHDLWRSWICLTRLSLFCSKSRSWSLTRIMLPFFKDPFWEVYRIDLKTKPTYCHDWECFAASL